MALRIDYLARETGQNLIRNWLLSAATVLIVTVSLTMFGITLLLGYGLGNAFIRWNNDVSFIVYMNPDASKDQVDSIRRDLEKSKQVDQVEYFDTTKSYDLAKKLFAQENPEILSSLKPEDLPTSFRVKPSNPDAAVVKEMAANYAPKTGVFKVDFPDEQVRQVQRAGNKIKTWASPRCSRRRSCSSSSPSRRPCSRGGARSRSCAWWARPTGSSGFPSSWRGSSRASWAVSCRSG